MEFNYMNKCYRVRIYPNKQQEELIQKTFGCCRFVYNYYLNKRITMWKENEVTFNYYDCSRDLTQLKKELSWLSEVDDSALRVSLKNLDTAYKNYFNKYSNFPKFKSKKNNYKSYTTKYTHKNIYIKDNYIRIPKLNLVKFRDKRDIQGRILGVTISQVPSGKYYASICCDDVVIQQYPKTNKEIGLDLGIKDFVITSEGVKYDNPKYLKQSLDKLAKLQRELSRKTKGSSNWNKARIKVARQYEKIANQRRDYLNKLTTELINGNDVICIEDLDIKEMIQENKSNMRRNISDVSWYEFTRELQYKADWYGKEVIKVDRYFASSQICSCCGVKSPITKNLSVRKWECPNCNAILDRDINSAINILNEGIKQTNNL